MFANQIYYPISMFAILMKQTFSLIAARIFLTVYLIALLLFFSLAIIRLLQLVWHSRYSKTIISTSASFLLFGFLIYAIHSPAIEKTHSLNKPNIIIIGLDAVRPDYINQYNTPTLYRFINKSTYFTNSFTPLARTFPAWVSILTGLYPKNHGARFTFKSKNSLPNKDMLSVILQQQDYFSIYATDDSEFDNFDHHYGFDKIIAPNKDAPGYFINASSDFPLSNLLLNFKIGELIFPYIYASRSAYVTYNPKSFINKISNNLNKIENRPIFFSVHFCLPHWPYVWATSPDLNINDSEAYESSLHKVDQQLASFLILLHQHNLLNNSIVVMLSDHGESLGLHGDRLLSPRKYIPGNLSDPLVFQKLKATNSYDTDLDTSLKHGTDVLSLSQDKNFLAIRIFGPQKNTPSKIATPVSLIDIKPTILSLLNIKNLNHDGISLSPYIKGKQTKSLTRPIYIESGLNISAIRSKVISIRDLAKQSAPLLQIDPKTMMVYLKENARKKLLIKKQRAIYYENWILALYPQTKQETIPVLINCKTKQWTDDLSCPFAQNSPLKIMMHQMKNFYGKEFNLNTTRARLT